MSLRLPLSALLVSSSLGGCAMLFDFDELSDRVDAAVVVDADIPDGAAEPIEAGPDADVCPAIPPNDRIDVPGAPYLVALGSVQLFAEPGPATGYDLDGITTVSRATSSCALAADLPESALGAVVDTACGIDNSSQKVFANATLAGPQFTFAHFAEQVLRAQQGVVLTLGDLAPDLRNDGHVFLQWLPARYLHHAGSPPGNCAPRDVPDAGDGGAPVPPSYLDAWCYDGEVTAGAGISTIVGQGYVHDGTLVGLFDDVYLPDTNPADPRIVSYLHFRQVQLTATLGTDAAGHLQLTAGRLVGRWKASDLIYQVAAVYDVSLRDAAGGCRIPESLLPQFRSEFCSLLDIGSDPGADAATPCDAVSVSVGFDAYQVAALGPRNPAFRAYEYRCDGRQDVDGMPTDGGAIGPSMPLPGSQDCF